ncbi:MAG: T9SS type A sorting domain-containing protein [Candidatus Kapaibacteriota bacterium]
MKKFVLLVIFVFYINNIQLYSFEEKNLSIKPLNFKYNGIVGNGELLIAYGNLGILNISNNGGKNWSINNIFDNGFILDIKIIDNNIYAFNNDGKIKLSSDGGKNWNILLDIKEEVYSTLLVENNLIIRSDYFISKYDINGNIIKKYEFNSYDYFAALKIKFKVIEQNYYLNLLKNSMIFFNNKVLVYNNTKFFDILDTDLNYIQNFEVYSDNSIEFFVHSSFLKDKNYLYFQLNNKYVKTNDMKSFSEIQNDENTYLLLRAKNIEENIMFFKQSGRRLELYKIDENGNFDLTNVSLFEYSHSPINESYFTDFSIKNDSLYFVTGIYNSGIGRIKLFDKDNQFVDIISESPSIFTLNSIKTKDYLVIHTLSTITSSISNDEIIKKDESLLNFKFNYSNLFFQSNLEISAFNLIDNISTYAITNFCEQINYNKITQELILGYFDNATSNYVFYDNLNTNGNFSKFKQTFFDKSERNTNSNLFRNETGELFFINYNSTPFGTTSRIEVINNDYTPKHRKIIKNKNYFYIFNDNNNTGFENTLLEYDFITKSKFVLTADDTLGQFNQVLEFKNTYLNKYDAMDFKANEKNYLVFTNYYRDSTLDINIYDISERLNKTIKFVKNPNLDIMNTKVFYTFDNDSLFVIIKDSIFYMDYINQIDSLVFYAKLPNNGQFIISMNKFGDDLFGTYEDDIRPKNYYKLSLKYDDEVSVEDNFQIEDDTFIHTAEPYPNPTNNVITVPVYWGKGISITKENIEIYDVMGNFIQSNDNLKFENFSDYRGFIYWNTTNVPKGTYLIKIQHGNNTKTVKVVVN